MSIEALEIICAKCRGNEWGPDTPRKEILAWFHDFAAAAIEQAQRQPLTDEQVRDLWSWSATAEAERTATTQQHAFARAIERAHGIGGGE